MKNNTHNNELKIDRDIIKWINKYVKLIYKIIELGV